MTHRPNILSSSRPSDVKETKWNNTLSELRNNELWDSAVMNAIKYQGSKEKNERPIFDIPQSLRDDCVYWHNRRNDCAHYKDNEITLAHVCAFWSFMMSSYRYFVPLGSIDQCINEYEIHFDISLTPDGANDDEIFNHLCMAIRTADDVKNFIQQTKSSRIIKSFQRTELLHRLLLTNDTLQKAVKEVAMGDENLLYAMIRMNIFDIPILVGDNAKWIRKLWYESTNSVNGARFYFELLRCGLIPQEELRESMRKYLNLYYENGNSINMVDIDSEVLTINGLYEVFLDEFFTRDVLCSNLGTKCRKTDFYISVIRIGGINDKFLKNLTESLKSSFPYTLRPRLKSLLAEDAYIKAYTEGIERLGLEDLLHINNN